MNVACLPWVFFILLPLAIFSCKEKNTAPSKEAVNEIGLKRGPLISCGPADQQFGSVSFAVSSNANVQKDFNLGIKLLHSFEYDEAEKVFAKIIDEQPDFAMAYWGVAMSNFHPLWMPPSALELKKGARSIEIAQAMAQQSKQEVDYINAIASFYKDWDKVDHRTRCLNYEKAMERMYTNNPGDKEAAIFYALSLVAAADPSDKSFQKQKKAGLILQSLYPKEPNHPGVAHYLIHAFDYPGLAEQALPAARKYAAIAPSSAHALHMPSHIFTRLGLWEECLQSNLASVASAQCYAVEAGIKGHWDEELHGLDYLVYAYLQKGQNDSAKKQWDYLKTITDVNPVNFKVAYAFAAIPSRYLLENKLWKEAASLPFYPQSFPWKDYPWQKAIVHFTRLMGAAHMGDLAAAKKELEEINSIQDTLTKQKKAYEANQVLIQAKAGEAWIRFGEGKKEEALALMNLAADREDKTEKHPVTPCEVAPARELVGDMLLQMNLFQKALDAYEANLKIRPNRFNSLYGAATAAEKTGHLEKAKLYYGQLLAVAKNSNTNRPEIAAASRYLKN